MSIIKTIIVLHKVNNTIMELYIGSEQYNQLLLDHPEWFPEQAKHIKLWKLIPEDVKELYIKEQSLICEEFCKSCSGGLLESIKLENHEVLKKARDIFAQKEQEIYNKYFSKYGLTK